MNSQSLFVIGINRIRNLHHYLDFHVLAPSACPKRVRCDEQAHATHMIGEAIHFHDHSCANIKNQGNYTPGRCIYRHLLAIAVTASTPKEPNVDATYLYNKLSIAAKYFYYCDENQNERASHPGRDSFALEVLVVHLHHQ